MNCSSTSQGLFPLDSGLYGYPSPSTKLLHGLYNNDDDDDDHHPDPHSLFNAATTSINTNYPSNYLIKPSLPIPPPSHPVSPALHFTNNTPFWNASHAPPSIEIPQNCRLGFKVWFWLVSLGFWVSLDWFWLFFFRLWIMVIVKMVKKQGKGIKMSRRCWKGLELKLLRHCQHLRWRIQKKKKMFGESWVIQRTKTNGFAIRCGKRS